ncbi:hypothetical protein NHQ30_009360 [Ciborinia camelliae]|nr:hypothetical protein NHQ30_009360 [Ciborinia camelliae]
MEEQVIDPAKLTLSMKDRETILEGNAKTYAEPDQEGLKTLAAVSQVLAQPAVPKFKSDPQDTNLLPFQQLEPGDLTCFWGWCRPDERSVVNIPLPATRGVSAAILKVTDAYLRQICLFVNSHSPERNGREDYPTMAYLPHDFWAPPTNPPTEEYIEDRATFIRTTAHLPPPRLRALTHLFIHIAPFASKLDRLQESALIVITPRAATIEYFDQHDNPDRHHLLADMMNVISRVDPDRHSTWLELADWKCRAGTSGGRAEALSRPPAKRRESQVYVCTNALAQAFGYDVNMECPADGVRQDPEYDTMYDNIIDRKVMVIIIDLVRGYFSNVIHDRQYRPRIKRMFGHHTYEEGVDRPWMDNWRQKRNGPPWVHFSEQIYRRLLPRELAQWNGENKWRGLDEEALMEQARTKGRMSQRVGRYDGAPTGAELGEFGLNWRGRRARRLRSWLEDKDCEGKRVDRYHPADQSLGRDYWHKYLALA